MVAAILAVFLIFFVGANMGSQLSDLEDKVKDHVSDKARRKIIINTCKELEKDMKSMSKTLDTHFGDLAEAHHAYASTATDFNTVTAKLKANQKAAAKMFLDARDSMHRQMTREEWTAVFQASEK